MLKEKNPLLHVDLKEEESYINNLIKNVFESFYTIFSLILENPIESFWYEFMAIIISYTQLFFYIFEKAVSKLIKIINFYYYIF
jgi:hypothetical protein